MISKALKYFPVILIVFVLSILTSLIIKTDKASALAGVRSKAFSLAYCISNPAGGTAVSINNVASQDFSIFRQDMDNAGLSDGLAFNAETNGMSVGVGVQDFYDSAKCMELAKDSSIGDEIGENGSLMNCWVKNTQGVVSPKPDDSCLESFLESLGSYVSSNNLTEKEAYERTTQWFAECTTVGSASDNNFTLKGIKYQGSNQDLYYKYNRDIQPVVGEDLVRYLHDKVGGNYADGGGWGVLECGNAEEIGQALKIYDEDEIARLGADISDSESRSADDSGDDTAPNCENTSGITGWIVCPIIDGAFSLMRVIEGSLAGQLKFTLDDIGQDDRAAYDNVKAAYNSILITANVLFAIGILWIVISQAITGGGGGGFFGAYEAKKILPKLIAGIIVANLSWDLVNLLLIVSNAVGESIKSIMLAPFGDAATQAIDLGGWSGVLVGGAAVTAVALAFFGFFAVSPILIMIVISILLALAFAVFRKAIIIVLVVLAPIALALSPFMPALFKRYYKLLLNLILFYPIVMIAIAATTIIAYITIQSAGNADSIGASLVRLAGMAIYFGWIFLVIGFAKNNFDVMGKVGGSLQSMGNKAGRQFGQNRLQGNQRRQERELKKNWRLQRKKEKALDSSFRKMTYGSRDGENNYLKKKRADLIQMQQAGIKPGKVSKKAAQSVSKIPLVGKRAGAYLDDKISERESEQTNMMSVAEDQVLESSVKKAQQEASYKSFSNAARSGTAQVLDSKGNVIAGASVGTLNDAYGHLAAGRTVRYTDVDNNVQTMSGRDKGVQYMAAGAIKEDAAQAYNLDSLIERSRAAGDHDTANAAQASLNYMTQNGGGSLAKSAPDLVKIPQSVSLGAGSTAEAITSQKDKALFRHYKDDAGNVIGTTGTALELLNKNDTAEVNQVLGEFAAMQDPANAKSRFNKASHNQAMANAIDHHFSSGGAGVDYNGATYTDAASLRATVGI